MNTVASFKLVFVYNAKSGKHNALLDSIHKVLSPNTYSCSLCDITHGVFSEDKLWKNYRDKSAFAMEFLHKDEFLVSYGLKYKKNFSFPVVLIFLKNELEVFITTKELATLKDSRDLITLIEEREKSLRL